MRTIHFDRGTLKQPKELPNGFLRVDAFLTRVGVFLYQNNDGTLRRELRLPDEVFNEDSLDGLRGTALTFGHPADPVSLDNAKDLQIGSVGVDVRRDGAAVRGQLTVNDKDAIAKMKKGTKEVSCGYWADFDPTPGVTSGIDGVADGLAYDGIQRNIKYNHAAIVDHGRAGSSISARMDASAWRCDDVSWSVSETGVVCDSLLAMNLQMLMYNKGLTIGELATVAATTENGMESILSGMVVPTGFQIEALAELFDVSDKSLKDLLPDRVRDYVDSALGDKMKFKITIDGVSYEIEGDESAQQALTQKITRDASQLADAVARAVDADKHVAAIVDSHKSEIAKESARADAALEKVSELEKARADAMSPEVISKAVAARVLLENQASKVIGSGFKADGQSDDEIRRAVVLKVSPGAVGALDGGDPLYLRARFDQAVESAPVDTSRKSNSVVVDAVSRNDGSADRIGSKLDAATADYAKRNDSMWSRPLSASKDSPSAPAPVTVRQ